MYVWTAPRGARAPAHLPSAIASLRRHDAGLGQCVPVPARLTTPAAVAGAVRGNARLGRLLGWRHLRDQIEVNHLGCARADPRLTDPQFAQAVAGFQHARSVSHHLTVDGMLGAATWRVMQAQAAEREPFPRDALSGDFDATPRPATCSLHEHPAIDVPMPGGTPIPAVADGRVVYAGIMGAIRGCPTVLACRAGTGPPATCNLLSGGRIVILEHPDRGPGMQPGGDSVYTYHLHVQFRGSHAVKSGEMVRAGRIIAEVGAGCVGNSNGPHLHYVVATGPRGIRLTGGGPSRCQLCSRARCAVPGGACTRCAFDHFWDLVTPRRPRTVGGNIGFRW